MAENLKVKTSSLNVTSGPQLKIMDKNPVRRDEDWVIPHDTMNLRHYLTKTEFPREAYEPLHVKFHFFDKRACGVADRVNRDVHQKWSSLDTSKTGVPVFPKPDQVLGLNSKRVKETIQAIERLVFTVSPTDEFQPHASMALNLFDRVPTQLRKAKKYLEL